MPEIKDWFVPVASGVAAILGVANVYLNNVASGEIARLNARIVRIGEERKFASDIMERFDKVVVDAQSDRQTRLSRLGGLMALAGLMTHDKNDDTGRDTQGILAVIQSQADDYKREIAEASKTATGAEADKLQAQYAQASAIGNSATLALNKISAPAKPAPTLIESVTGTGPAAVPTPRISALDRIRVDIFWCSGSDQSADALAAANTLYGKRPATAQGAWRVRALSAERNAAAGYRLKGQVIRIDREDERPVANQLNALAGGGFGVDKVDFVSPNYISVFICPA